tara:strand:- start:830 stop:1843 length:1014 start_codon:yes stop_codon:yes gene_type:complete
LYQGAGYYHSEGAQITGPHRGGRYDQVCGLRKQFAYTGSYYTGYPTNRGRFTIDSQWALKASGIEGQQDSSYLNGVSGLTCRNINFAGSGETLECRECGRYNYGTPSSLAADFFLDAFFHHRPVEVEMGTRYLGQWSGSGANRRPVVAGGIWGSDGRNMVQITQARTFKLQPGLTIIVRVRNNEVPNSRADYPGYDKGWLPSPAGDNPIATAVYHSPIPHSQTATDEDGHPLLQCFGKNLNLSFVAKSQQSDAMLKDSGGVGPLAFKLDGFDTGTSCVGKTDPPFVAQTTNYYRQINDFGSAGTITLSTSEAIVDIFLGDDFAAEIEADASCTVTDG